MPGMQGTQNLFLLQYLKPCFSRTFKDDNYPLDQQY